MGLDATIGIPVWVVIIVALDTIAVAFVAVQMFPLLSDLRKCVRYFKALGVDEPRSTEPYAPEPLAPREPSYNIFVKDCRQNANINGTVLRQPLNTFEFLLSLVHAKQ